MQGQPQRLEIGDPLRTAASDMESLRQRLSTWPAANSSDSFALPISRLTLAAV